MGCSRCKVSSHNDLDCPVATAKHHPIAVQSRPRRNPASSRNGQRGGRPFGAESYAAIVGELSPDCSVLKADVDSSDSTYVAWHLFWVPGGRGAKKLPEFLFTGTKRECELIKMGMEIAGNQKIRIESLPARRFTCPYGKVRSGESWKENLVFQDRSAKRPRP